MREWRGDVWSEECEGWRVRDVRVESEGVMMNVWWNVLALFPVLPSTFQLSYIVATGSWVEACH